MDAGGKEEFIANYQYFCGSDGFELCCELLQSHPGGFLEAGADGQIVK